MKIFVTPVTPQGVTHLKLLESMLLHLLHLLHLKIMQPADGKKVLRKDCRIETQLIQFYKKRT